MPAAMRLPALLASARKPANWSPLNDEDDFTSMPMIRPS
jgi:hypothetical protein